MEPPKAISRVGRARLLAPAVVSLAALGITAVLLGHGGHPWMAALAVLCVLALAGLSLRITVHDLDAERRLESALRFQQQLLERIPIPVFYKDSEGIYLGCNRSYEEFMGRDRSQIIGRSVFEVAPAAMARIYQEQDLHLLAHGGVQIYESRVVRNAIERFVVFHKAIFERPEGGVGGLIGAILDVTEQREARERSQVLAREQQVILDTVPVGILKVVDRKIVWANSTLEAMAGWPKGGLAGQSTRVLYPSEERYLGLIQEMQPLLSSGKPFRIDQELARRDGGRTWVGLSGMAQFPEDLSKGSFWAFEDITVRRATEQRLRDTLRQNEETMADLQAALQKVKTLTGLLPICASCKKIRDEAGHWNPLEVYISNRTEAGFTHGICPDCAKVYFPGS